VSQRLTGYFRKTGPNGVEEGETFTCAHDQRLVRVPPRADPAAMGGVCKVCMGLICPRCVASGKCDPFEKKLEREEARGRLLRSAGL
jgi:hypothetical protein